MARRQIRRRELEAIQAGTREGVALRRGQTAPVAVEGDQEDPAEESKPAVMEEDC